MEFTPVVPFASGSTAASAPTSFVNLSRKIRKPYTITKSRKSWTEPEHDKFLEALQLFDRDWKKIEIFIGSKTVIQIRSHAQKYFLKVQKNGTSEHLPPPRPKRKAAHPYPPKASKNVISQSSSAPLEPGYVLSPNSSYMLRNPIAGQTVTSNSCSGTESAPRTWPTEERIDQANHGNQLRVLPDFAQVYSFIGSVFDPYATGHLQKLEKMDPIDVETVLLLMRNLSINLTSPDFEDHRRLLSSYKIDSEI